MMWAVHALLFVECILSTAVSSFLPISDSLGIVVVSLNSIFVYFVLNRIAGGDKNLQRILILGFCIRWLLLILDLYGRNIFVLPGSGNDTEMFHSTALAFPNFEFMDNPYSYFVGLIYSIADDQRIIAQYVNLLFSISTILMVLRVFDEFKINYQVKLMLTAILTFIPNYMIASVILLRESLMIFLLAASLYSFVKWWKYNGLGQFVFSIVFVLLASTFHSGVIANAAAYILVFILCNNKARTFKLSLASFIAAGMFMVLFMTVFNQYSSIFLDKFGSVENVNDITNRTSLAQSGGSAYNVGGDVNSFSDLIINSPIRIFYFITSPLPWYWRGLNDIIAFLFSAMFYFLSYVYAIKALTRSEKGNIRSFIIVGLILAFLSAFIFAWGVSNAGTAMRHRDKFIVNYIVMLGLALHSIKQSQIRFRTNHELQGVNNER